MQVLKIITSLNKKPAFAITVLSLISFMAITLVYYLVFVYPINSSKEALNEARKFATDLKLINSQSALTISSLSSINPSHPEYKTMMEGLLSDMEIASGDYQKLKNNYKSFRIKGTGDVKKFMKEEFKKEFDALLTDFDNSMNLYSTDIGNLKKANSVVSLAVSYNPYTDLGSLDLNEDKLRETALDRAEGAIKGLSDTYRGLEGLDNNNKAELLANLSITINQLKDFSKYLSEGDISKAEQKRSEFLTSYKDVIQNGTQLIRGYLNTESIGKARVSQENINSKLDKLIEKIDITQKNLPEDPLKKS